MTLLVYRARDVSGALVEGEIEGYEIGQLQTSLENQGLIPISIKEAGDGLSLDNLSLTRLNNMLQKVQAEDLLVFTRQFSTLFKAGLSMDVILGTLGKQVTNPKLKDALSTIKMDVNSGTSIAGAFEKHPEIFDKLYTSMLTAGEEAGILEKVLDELVIVIEKQIEIKANVKSATLYPKIVIGVLVCSMYVLMTFVIPKFMSFFAKFGADLPLFTRILIATSNFFTSYWWLVLALAGGSVFAFKKYYSTYSGRLLLDGLFLKVPVFGQLALKTSMAQYGHLLASLYKSGLPLPRCFDIMTDVIDNRAISEEVRVIKDGIEKGTSISEMMRNGKYFSPIMIETTAIGEKTGSLDEMLEAVSSHYDLEVKYMTKNLSTMLEPMLLCFIFGMVVVVLMGVALPMFNMSQIMLKN